jgi:hypothetical protein
VKLTGPYWFHFVPYQTRIYAAAVLMASSFLFVSLGQIMDNNLGLQLFGIVLGSVQSGFGWVLGSVPACLSVCLFVCLSVCLPVCLTLSGRLSIFESLITPCPAACSPMPVGS